MAEKENHSFIQKIGDLSHDAVVLFDTIHLKFMYANQVFRNFFNLPNSSSPFYLNDIYPWINEEDIDYVKLKSKELLEVGQINSAEFRLTKSNNAVFIHLSCDAFLIDNKQLAVAFIKDISQIKQHEDYLIKYTAQKDTLLDMLTHNLTGPLILSRDLMSSLKANYSDPGAVKIIELLLDNTKQCIDIVNDFLRTEHFESTLIHVRNTRFDVVQKLHETIEKLKLLNPKKQFIVETELESLNINSDPVKFFQIVHNILSNAIKFTSATGKIQIYISEHKNHYLFKIKDDGIGINDALKSTLFTKKVKGTIGLNGEKSSGLGLAIAHELITLLRGKIYFESTEGVGSEFFIELPKDV